VYNNHYIFSDHAPRFAVIVAIFTALIVFPAVIKAEGISQGAMLANSCAGCHGTDGKSPGSIPSIAGKTPQFIQEALMGFRDGSRPSTVMGRHANGYSDEEIKLIADFFSTSK